MSDVAFTLYKGFLIVEYSETDVRAYRSRVYYASNTSSYESTDQAYISQMIDVAGDKGDFTELEYNTLMQDLGRAGPPDEGPAEPDVCPFLSPECDGEPVKPCSYHKDAPDSYCPLVNVVGSLDKGIEKAAAYIAGLTVGREDIDSPEHPIWLHMEEEYKVSYRRRARRVIELAGRS